MASEIRVDKINSLSGVGTVTLSPTGVDIAGITTVSTLKATTGIVTTLTATGSAKVGSGVTLSPDGDIFATGISTFSGGVKTTAGNISVRQPAGTEAKISINEATTNNSFTLKQTDTQALIQTSASQPFNIRAQSGSGSTSYLAFWTRDDERLRITSAGLIGIGTDAPENDLHIINGSATMKLTSTTSANSTRLILESEEDSYGGIHFGDPSDEDSGRIRYYHGGSNPDHMQFSTGATERLRILSTGGITFNGDTATANALDDYEEGDWTPTFVGGSASITVTAYAVQYGKYIKIGRMVYVEGLLRANVTNNSNGTYDLGGLPFTVSNTPNASGILHGKEQSSWTVAPDHFSCMNNTTKARARGGLTVGANAYTNANSSGFNSGSSNNNRIYIAGSYRVEG